MTTPASSAILIKQRQKYIWRKGLLYSLQLLAAWLVLGTVMYKWPFYWVWVLVGILGVGVISAFIYRLRELCRIDTGQVARHLNRRFPELEESTGLLLKPPPELTLLERYQLPRLQQQLQQVQDRPVFTFRIKTTILLVGVAVLVSGGLLALPDVAGKIILQTSNNTLPAVPPALKKALPAVKQLQVTITPPAYTGKKAYTTNQPSFKAESGARVEWLITTTAPVKKAQLQLNNQKKINFVPLKNATSRYRATQLIKEPALYTIQLDEKKTDYFAIELIPDQAPVIQINQPKSYIEISFGQSRQLHLQGTISDDYGLTKANLVATVASGSGEAVKFRETILPLALTKVNAKRYTINQLLNLNKLGMTYGDELYFYLQAWDNQRQFSRTDAFLVQIEDTTVVESATDLAVGINPLPAYFRSQRQLIIDTEKLLQEAPVLRQAVFQERANNLGIDQKLLRLRYGKFLGEEFESAIGHDPTAATSANATEAKHIHENEHPEQNPISENPTVANPAGNEGDLLHPYIHKHDTAEEATFFEPAVKAQLKAALAQMWEAELHLRTHQPKKALPFEYKALRLLKEVQQKSRAYVRKTGFDLPPIKEAEKRLTGDLSQVTAVTNQDETKEKITYPNIRQALPWLARQIEKPNYQPGDAFLLQKAGDELGQAILQKPAASYLKALQELRTIITAIQAKKPLCRPCLQTIAAALEQLIPLPPPKPHAVDASRHPLADSYFRRL